MRRVLLVSLPVLAALAIFALRRPAPTLGVASATASEPKAEGLTAPPAVRLTAKSERAPEAPSLSGLDLSRLAVDDSGVSAPLPGGRTAKLTLDPDLQRTAVQLLRAFKLPEAVIVMASPETGDVLAYASHVEQGKTRDLAVEAHAPAASVFKVITGAALVEQAGLSPDTRQCYSGGEHDIRAIDLEDSPTRDRWCTTLAGAMGRSTNTVFARLAQKHLKAHGLEEMARGFGFGDPVPFDVPLASSTIKLPDTALGFARTAAGFWNTTLSPIESLTISATVARGGEVPRLRLVREVLEDGKPIWSAPAGATVLRRAVSAETAKAVTTMMEHTVSEGTSYRAFRDRRGASFLPDLAVAGKTGTLTDPQTSRFYTWFTGFAPSRPHPAKQVAIAVLVVNNPTWKVKANVVAREMLRAYFAGQKVERVSKPKIELIARR